MEIFNSKIAKLFLMKGYDAITLGCISLFKKKKKEVNKKVRKHEAIHRRQYVEMFKVSLIPSIIVAAFTSPWFLLFPIVSFYAWYLGEYSYSRIKRKIKKTSNKSTSYNSIAFEQEAYYGMNKKGYLNNREMFQWINYLGKY